MNKRVITFRRTVRQQPFDTEDQQQAGNACQYDTATRFESGIICDKQARQRKDERKGHRPENGLTITAGNLHGAGNGNDQQR